MIRKVAVIMGSDSDWPVVKGACAQLKALDIPFEAHILSAHRTPAEAWRPIWLVPLPPTPPCLSSVSR